MSLGRPGFMQADLWPQFRENFKGLRVVDVDGDHALVLKSLAELVNRSACFSTGLRSAVAIS